MKTPLTLVVALAFLAGDLRANEKTKTLDVTWIDSEGGGSTLIVTPAGESVLIDTGNPGGRDPARIVAAAKAAGLARIDYVLLTHFHIDHFGGGAEVAQQIPIGTIYERVIPDHDPDGRAQSSFPLQIKPWREIAARRERLAPGVVIPLKDAPGAPHLELRCLAADQKFIAPDAVHAGKNARHGGPKEIAPSDNDNSAVFVLTFGDFKFFDGGDLTWNFEAQLVTPYNLPGTVDVYQTDHHGLDVSNNPLLIQSLEPTVVVMNNGPHKGGMPGAFAAIATVPSVQARYQVHRSFQPGLPAGANAADEFIANRDDLAGRDAIKCPGNVIQMSVAPDTKSYRISIPANHQSQMYRTRSS
jgi:competence protein ComEC